MRNEKLVCVECGKPVVEKRRKCDACKRAVNAEGQRVFRKKHPDRIKQYAEAIVGTVSQARSSPMPKQSKSKRASPRYWREVVIIAYNAPPSIVAAFERIMRGAKGVVVSTMKDGKTVLGTLTPKERNAVTREIVNLSMQRQRSKHGKWKTNLQ